LEVGVFTDTIKVKEIHEGKSLKRRINAFLRTLEQSVSFPCEVAVGRWLSSNMKPTMPALCSLTLSASKP
jgi:hypothetical protein